MAATGPWGKGPPLNVGWGPAEAETKPDDGVVERVRRMLLGKDQALDLLDEVIATTLLNLDRNQVTGVGANQFRDWLLTWKKRADQIRESSK